jgi:hypothetical protein
LADRPGRPAAGPTGREPHGKRGRGEEYFLRAPSEKNKDLVHTTWCENKISKNQTFFTPKMMFSHQVVFFTPCG